MKQAVALFLCVLLVAGISGCAKGSVENTTSESAAGDSEKVEESMDSITPRILIDDKEIPVVWESCAAVSELASESSEGDIVVDMSMYGGWEQVGSLGRSYTTDDRQMTASSGDIVLYDANKIVLFYGSNSWAYTRLGKIDLPEEEVAELLSHANVTLKICA